MNVTAAIPVTEASQVAEGRRMALWLGSHLDFTEERGGRAGLIASELGSNLAKHARGGELLFRRLTTAEGEAEGMEILALDKGPGMSDVGLSRRDGYSTSGTLGHGLGALERQADEIDIFSNPSGTIIAARLYRDGHRSAAPGRFEIGAIHVAQTGEPVCGDDWSWRMREGRLSVFMADGLGHGLPAHEAAVAATRTFAAHHELPPARLVDYVHAALRPTRGAAVAALAIDVERRTASFAGLGNIGGVIVAASVARHRLVSHNGTAGHSAARIQEFAYPVPPQAAIVLFSDGLGSHWDLSNYPGLVQRSPSLIAAALYRDHSRRRDDVTVVVVKERPPVAEKL